MNEKKRAPNDETRAARLNEKTTYVWNSDHNRDEGARFGGRREEYLELKMYLYEKDGAARIVA